MAKNKTTIEYVCKECSSTFSKWSGKCSACGAWSTLEERIIEDKANKRGLGGQDLESSSQTLKSIQSQENQRLSTGNSEFDRTLGGGLAPGSLILIGGDPGIGKSTLVLQTLATMSAANVKTLYVSGEESAVQVKIRSERLELSGSDMLLMCETNLEKVLA
ncbi:MAG TPA: ATPase domain-containing protein, partial [Fibrobacteraceae bacterium]|nr:ATPase domain-containing protein [Fibrobacteraceae bacterium]